MSNYIIKRCTLEDIEEFKEISEKTFFETFAGENTEEDMKNYLEENFSYEQVEKEVSNEESIFYIVKDQNELAAYMKVNFAGAQTEEGYNNSLL